MFSDKRLGFLHEVLYLRGISKAELSERLGVSKVAVFQFFRKDDMKLSHAKRIMSGLGYDLVVYLEREGDDIRPALDQAERILADTGRRQLTFLKVAFKKYNIDKTDLAERIGMHISGVSRWFRVDDIMISHLYQIAEIYDLKLNVIPELKVI